MQTFEFLPKISGVISGSNIPLHAHFDFGVILGILGGGVPPVSEILILF